jgi:uncharacterized protein YdgA (DUF945 family)
MNKLVGAVVIILVAAAGMTGAAYWSGMQAEHWYREALAEGSRNPNVKLDTVRYQRGLFSSQAVTRVRFVTPEGGDPNTPDPSFSIRQDIYHGPLPLAGRGVPGVPMQWTGAVVRATLDPDSSAWSRELAKWYGNQEPVVALSQIGFDGASDTRITMPPLTLSNVEDLQSLSFSGLQGQFQVAARGAAIQGAMTVSSLEATGKPTAATEGQPAGGSVRINLRDLAMSVNQRKGAFDLLFGDSSFKVGELSARDQGTGTPFVVTNLSMTGSLSPQGPQQVAGEVLIKADKVAVDQQSGTGGMKLALRNLDGPTVGQLQQWQQQMASKPDDPQALDELLKLVKALLRGKPEFVLDTQATLAQGEWLGKLTLNFQDFGDVNLSQNPAGALGALEKGLAEATASKALVETLLADTIEEQLQTQLQEQGQQAGESALQGMAARQATEQLQSLMSAGFIRLEGGLYKSTARFEGGKLFVNDQEIPLALAAGGEDGAAGDQMPLEPDGGAEEEETPQQ